MNFQYLALDYLHQMKKWVIFDDMEKIKKLTVSKSWWDTVDALDELVGHLLLTGRKQATENDSTAYETGQDSRERMGSSRKFLDSTNCN